MRAGWARARIIRGLSRRSGFSGVPGAAAGGRGWSLGASEGVTATLPEVVKDIIRKINFEVYPSQVAGAGPVGGFVRHQGGGSCGTGGSARIRSEILWHPGRWDSRRVR